MFAGVAAGVIADLPNPTVDPGKVKAATKEILGRPEFQPKKRTLLQAAWHWLTTQIGKLLAQFLGRAGGFGSWLESLVVVVVVVAAIGFLVWVVVRHRGPWGGRSRPPGAHVRT
ncbi:MAG: hypothetical protein ACRDZ8_11900, partial [Acidimicrobiales bacterium]